MKGSGNLIIGAALYIDGGGGGGGGGGGSAAEYFCPKYMTSLIAMNIGT